MAHIAPESPVLGEALERRAMLLRARNSHTRLLVSLLLALASLYEANHSVLLRAFVPPPPQTLVAVAVVVLSQQRLGLLSLDVGSLVASRPVEEQQFFKCFRLPPKLEIFGNVTMI